VLQDIFQLFFPENEGEGRGGKEREITKQTQLIGWK
jgi:hypothetical protein